jgi:hypothetical protein
VRYRIAFREAHKSFVDHFICGGRSKFAHLFVARLETSGLEALLGPLDQQLFLQLRSLPNPSRPDGRNYTARPLSETEARIVYALCSRALVIVWG